ncbi:MAG: hypothetical protein ABSD41_11520 [Candidatus Bathyarchaeia archaeon]
MSKDKETQQLSEIEDLLKNLKRDIDANLVDLKAQLNVAQKKATKTVTERPLLALGVAFVAGMAVGIALSKSSD